MQQNCNSILQVHVIYYFIGSQVWNACHASLCRMLWLIYHCFMQGFCEFFSVWLVLWPYIHFKCLKGIWNSSKDTCINISSLQNSKSTRGRRCKTPVVARMLQRPMYDKLSLILKFHPVYSLAIRFSLTRWDESWDVSDPCFKQWFSCQRLVMTSYRQSQTLWRIPDNQPFPVKRRQKRPFFHLTALLPLPGSVSPLR